jgi:hypothetical protein
VSAQVQFVAQIVNGEAKPPRFGFRPFKKGHGATQGGFRPQARQAGKLVHYGLQRLW